MKPPSSGQTTALADTTVREESFGFPAWFMSCIRGLVLVSLVIEYGFSIRTEWHTWLDWLDVFLASCIGLDLLLDVMRSKRRKETLQSRRFEYVLLLCFLLSLAVGGALSEEHLQSLLQFLHVKSVIKFYLAVIQCFILFDLGIRVLLVQQKILAAGVRPEMLLAASFGALILLGTILLLLPTASADRDRPISGIDALFTATSASCVTGLVVRDTGKDFSVFGQVLILALFQLGGLGIITFVALISVFSAGSMSIPQMVALREIVNARTLSDVKRQIAMIVGATVLMEGFGAACLCYFRSDIDDPLARLFWGIFHSVSAFCNAGFALQAESLIAVRTDWGVMLTFMTLIVLGGLGFLVIRDLASFRMTTLPIFRSKGLLKKFHVGKFASRLTIQTKISLTVTAFLIVVGVVGIWALEAHHLLRDQPFGEQFLVVAFQSITPRTAGFNSVPIDQLQDATLILLMALMVVGASPVSTGGGIKTVTLGVLFLSMRSMLKGKDRVEAFGRTLPQKVLFAALSVIVIYTLVATLSIFLLSLTDPGMMLQDQAFEVVSALSTVGLSTGITAELSTHGKLVLCLAMFVGRVGPLSLVMSVFQASRSRQDYEFPEEELVVG